MSYVVLDLGWRRVDRLVSAPVPGFAEHDTPLEEIMERDASTLPPLFWTGFDVAPHRDRCVLTVDPERVL